MLAGSQVVVRRKERYRTTVTQKVMVSIQIMRSAITSPTGVLHLAARIPSLQRTVISVRPDKASNQYEESSRLLRAYCKAGTLFKGPWTTNLGHGGNMAFTDVEIISISERMSSVEGRLAVMSEPPVGTTKKLHRGLFRARHALWLDLRPSIPSSWLRAGRRSVKRDVTS